VLTTRSGGTDELEVDLVVVESDFGRHKNHFIRLSREAL
jgi:hypothetical protein